MKIFFDEDRTDTIVSNEKIDYVILTFFDTENFDLFFSSKLDFVEWKQKYKNQDYFNIPLQNLEIVQNSESIYFDLVKDKKIKSLNDMFNNISHQPLYIYFIYFDKNNNIINLQHFLFIESDNKEIEINKRKKLFDE